MSIQTNVLQVFFNLKPTEYVNEVLHCPRHKKRLHGTLLQVRREVILTEL